MASIKNLSLAVAVVCALVLTYIANAAVFSPSNINVNSVNVTVASNICKLTVGGNATFGFATTFGNLSPASFSLSDGQCQLVTPFAFSILTENSIPPGWTFTQINFTPGTSTTPPMFTFVNTRVPTVVTIDIQPESCPNAFNVNRRGVLPVAILGSASFDVTTINVSTVRLQGVSPLRSALRDVATPSSGTGCFDCTAAGPDGFTDLVLQFDAQSVVAQLGSVTDGQCKPLTVTGSLLDGTPIAGADRVVIVKH